MWSTMGHWWSQPVDTLDRATVAMPRLLNERLEEFGIDFTTLYPSEGLFISSIEDPELRRVCCRRLQQVHRGCPERVFGPHDRCRHRPHDHP